MLTCSTTQSLHEEGSQLRELKEAVAVRKLTWKDVESVLKEVVGLWAADYDRAVRAGYDAGFCFESTGERQAHCGHLTHLLDRGCDLLLIIHAVEDGSEPPVDLKVMEKSLTNALRALKIARSAYSQSTEGLHAKPLLAVMEE